MSVRLSRGGRVLLLLLNALPLLHAVLVVSLLVAPYSSLPWRIVAAAAALYLLPPLAVRALFAVRRPVEGAIVPGSLDFFLWWASTQGQVVFGRFGALEELLRLVPGLYSAWLRLWGARIGRLTYWSAGTTVFDRPFLDLGDDVVFGAGVRLNPHVLARNERGELELLLATIRVGDRVLVGGYSLLSAGTELLADEATRAFLVSPPFSVWSEGRRVRDASRPD